MTKVLPPQNPLEFFHAQLSRQILAILESTSCLCLRRIQADSQQNHDTQLKSLQSLRRRLEAARAEFASLLRTDG